MLTMKELTERAFALGVQAAERNESRAPALNEEFMTMMQDNRGADWTPPLQAFARGYQSRIDAHSNTGDPQ